MERHPSWHRSAITVAALVMTLAVARTAAADTITLIWDANPESTVAGYYVYIGTQPGVYGARIDVGLNTSYAYTSAVAGTRYCFAVAAYASGPVEGPKSAEICGYSNQRPTLVSPGSQTTAVGQSVALQLAGSDPDGSPLTYSATGLPPGLSLMASTGFISGSPTTAGSYTVTATVSDSVLTASQTFAWTVSAPDTTAPAVTITAPTTATTYTTTLATVSLSGTASDNIGVTQVTWSSDRGGSGTATGTASWTASSLTLQAGTNVLTVTARDAAGNTSTDTLTVTYNAPDATLPVVTITGPTSASTYTTAASPLALSGTASDNVGVTQVTWANSRGGTGTATGTTSWSIASIVLQGGSNVITVTARDAAGNTATDTLTVTYNAPDTTAPAATITGPTSAATFSTSTGTLTLSGTASDNVGVTQVTWSSDRGGSGTATGTTAWSVSGIVLQSGSNVLTVTARDAAGNAAIDTLAVTYTPPDATAPAATISAPTSAATYTTATSPLALSGTASDNVGVTQVTWSNNRGGSGTATGTTSWSVASIALQGGDNIITVTARDAAGNTASDTLTVTYNAPDTTAPAVAFNAPTSAATYASATATLNVGGTASDDVGVTQVTWSNDRGGAGTATGTAAWNVPAITLQSGTNVLTVTARDAAGNTATDSLTVTYTPPDTTAPAIAISAPTSSGSFSTSTNTVALNGTASDNVGVSQVTWTNDRGGSGTASGTTAWSVGVVTLQLGANVITMRARDAAGNSATATLTVNYALPLALTSLTPNVTSPQVLGASVTFTATASGGTAPYQYKWWVFDGTTWTATQAWATSNTWTWTPTVAGSAYRVAVWVRSAGNTADADVNAASNGSIGYAITAPASIAPPLALSSLRSNLTSPQTVGTAITFSAAATGGTAPYQYKWLLTNGTSSSTVQGWSTSSSYTWTPTVAGSSYQMTVWVRSAGNTADAPENGNSSNVMAYAIAAAQTTPLALTSLTPNVASPQPAGSSITFTAIAAGGSAPYQFKWWVFDGTTWTATQTWTTSNSWTWTPTTAGTAYRVAVWVRNATSTADAYENTASNGSIGYVVSGTTAAAPPALAISSLQSSVVSPQTTGTTIRFTAGATGGTAPYQYKWWVNAGGTPVVLQNWSTSNTVSWTPMVAGSGYQLGVWVRNATSTADAPENSNSTASLPFVIAAPAAAPVSPLVLNGIAPSMASPQPVGTPVTFTAAVSGGLAPQEYKWWIFNGTSWSVTQTWSTNNTWTWTPSAAGSAYRVAVWVRNAGSAVDAYDNPSSNGSIPFGVYSATSAPPSAGLTLTGITANMASPQPAGTTVTFAAAASGGTAPYQYKWWLFDGVNWTVLQTWTTGNTFSWTPTAGSSAYRIGVWVRSATNTADTYDNSGSNGSLAFPTTSAAPSAPSTPILLTGLTGNLVAPQPAGTTVTFTATAAGGSGSYEYKWWIYNGSSWVVMQTWSNSRTWTWIPATPNPAYRVAVWIRNASSTTDAYDNALSNGSIAFPIQ